MQIGCGTALPTAFILRELLSRSDTTEKRNTTLHLQDYNLQVLKLVTLPNLLLAALPYLPSQTLHRADEADDLEGTVPDLLSPGEITITKDLKAGFRDLLEACGVILEFTYGDWSGLNVELEKGNVGYGLVMTSETIYEGSSLGNLIRLLRSSSKGKSSGHKEQAESKLDIGLEESLGALDVKEDWESKPLAEGHESVILIGAKVCYYRARPA
jgi:protein-histidine N-methyltransferase